MRLINGPGTKFHQGIDYIPRSQCRGDAILAVEGGMVSLINHGSQLKSIAITNGARAFVYMHIFRNEPADGLKSGNFVMKRIGNSNEYAIIDLEFYNGPGLPKGRALAVEAGEIVSYNNVDYTTVNEVGAREAIAPIGNSGVPGLDPHLHISLIESPDLGIPGGGRDENRSIDPWTELIHADNILSQRIRSRKNDPNFSKNICEHTGPGQDPWGQIIPSYSDNTLNCIEIEVAMQGADNPQDDIDPNTQGVQIDHSRYTNAVMDEEEIELEIRNTNGGVFSRGRGSYYETRFVVNPVGNKTLYPSSIYNTYGDPLVNGILPFTYRDNYPEIHPHDYYFFSDFYLRLHESDILHDKKADLANYPWQCKYEDGHYEARTRVLDLDGNVYPSNPTPFDIDNFKPFIREVSVNFEQVGVAVYWNRWNETSVPGELKLGTRQEGGLPNLNTGPLTAYAILSEDMQNVRAQIPSLNTSIVNGILIDASINKWKFDFGNVSGLGWDQCHKIIFTGLDLNSNQLLDFQIGEPAYCNWGITKKVTLPKRIDLHMPNQPADWDLAMAAGKDEVHRFRIKQCLGPGCDGLKETNPLSENNVDCDQLAQDIVADVHFTSSAQAADGSITLSFAGNPNVCLKWFDINHNQIGDGTTISNLLPGWYCYEVKLEQECCFVSDCVEVGTCAISVTPTLHHPSAPGVSDGSITISSTGGNEPVSYLWTNGATTSTVSNLSIGTYTVTVSDAYHCSSVATVNLINCPAITVVANASVTMPSACDALDGFINLHTNTPSGGMPPYAFHWEDEAGNVIRNGADDISNLGPGSYCLIAVDALGCTGSKCFDLIPDHYPTLEETILPACTNQSNGSINVVANSPLPGFYTFTWDDDVEDSGDVFSWRQNISSGTYCVTITSEENFCSVTKCYEVPSVSPNGPLSESHTIIDPCPNNSNGQINLTITGGLEPYTFDWLDMLELNEPKNRTGLGAGTYTVRVTDYCGSILDLEFNLVPVSIFKVLAHPGCAGLGQAEVTINQGRGNPPYSVSWSDGSNNYITNNLGSGEHCVSVFDAMGCMISECVTLKNKEYNITTVNSCVGMSDGVISLEIFNPNEEAVFVYLDGAEVYSNLAATPAFTVDISSLAGIVDYTISVTIGDCNYSPTEVRIKNDQIEHVFDHYNDPDNECVFRDECKGTVIPNSYTYQSPGYDLANGIAGIFSCKIPIYCGYQFIENMDFDKYTVRAAEYEQILLHAADLFSSAYMDKLLQYWVGLNLNPCRIVRYCSATMEIMSIGRTLAPNQEVQDDGNGCFSLDCTPAISWENNNFCLSDPHLNPPIFDVLDPINQGESCNPAKKNLYQLIVWEEDLKAAFPDLVDKDLYKEYIDVYREDPRAKCVDVIFCQRDFSVIWTTNIDLVHCDDYAQSPYGYLGDCKEGDETVSGCQQWVCANPTDNNIVVPEFEYRDHSTPRLNTETINIKGHSVTICPDFPGHFLTSPGNDEYIKTTNGCTEGTLVNFANAISEGIRFPKGITKCGGTFDFMDYSFKSIADRLWELPETEYLIDDWDSSQIALIRKIENEKSYSIDCHGDIGWSRLLTSNVRLKISYFEKEGNEYVIGGEFMGILYFGATQISTQYTNTGFLIRVSPQGTLLGNNLIRNLDPLKPLVFVRGEDGVHIVGRSTNQPLSVDGTVYQIQNGYLTDVRIGENSGSVASNLLAFDTSLTIVRSQRSLDNSRITYILKGSGSIHYGGEQVTGNNAQDLIVVTCNNSGSILWVEKINGQNIVSQDFDIVYGTSNNLLIGLTYNNTISVQGHTSTSNGNSDILLAQFNDAGELNGTLNYGTADGENISKMFFGDNVLYFGGEFQGDTMARKIGTHTFLIDSNVVSMPYMSFIAESSFTQEARGANNKSRRDADNAKPNSITVFPNPFSNDLTLRVVSSKFERISFKVFDGLGHLVNEQMQQANLGTNEYSILTSQYPIGVYLIQVLTESGTTWSHKIVKN